jgi:hypothetical protein
MRAAGSRGADPPADAAGRLRRSVIQIVLVGMAVAVVAMAAGWLFARGDAPGAARLLLRDEVTAEPLAEEAPGTDPAVPTSGPQRGTPRCGVVREPVPAEEQVATLASGVVIVQHRDDVDPRSLEALRDLVQDHDRLLLAPGTDLPAMVVATAWRHRLEQRDLDPGTLASFVVGYRDRGPDPRPCP